MKGINLGGFLSQCEHLTEHYKQFIKYDDIKQIADWGFDHVRLPIDYEVIEDNSGNPIEEGYQLLSEIISWCKELKLEIILDLHKAYGYDFNNARNFQKNNLFSNSMLQDRFISLWRTIANRFGEYDGVAFELLNEVVENENAEIWNSLISRTVDAIRAITTKTPIIYGGIQWNSANTVKMLEKPKHENIIFTFHFYEPLLFTHQKAYWVEKMNKELVVSYPDSMEWYRKESAKIGEQGLTVSESKIDNVGAEFIEYNIKAAIEAAKDAGVRLYCGEFGVIDKAPISDTFTWFNEIDKIFKKYNIGFSVWTYKDKDFGLIGPHYDSIRDKLINLWINE